MLKGSRSFYNLSKADTSLIKAVGIIFIVLHNYLRLINVRGENEMDFDSKRIMVHISSCIDNPLIILEAFFTFFGHYGVMLFIFASAYGLTKRQMKIQKEPYLKYLFHRLVKIYGLLIAGLVFFYICLYFQEGEWLSWNKYRGVIKHFLLMTSNFKISTLFLFVGPWWFFGLIVQFYVFFPLLYAFVKRLEVKGTWLLIILSYIVIYVLYYLGSRKYIEFPVFGNLIGHLPEFLLGILLAIVPSFKIDVKMFLGALAIFIASWFFEFIYPLSFLTVLIIMMYCLSALFNKSKDGYAIKFLLFIGQISMFLFLVNGPVRYSIIPLMETYFGEGLLVDYLGVVIHSVVVILISYLMYRIYAWVAKPIRKLTGISIL